MFEKLQEIDLTGKILVITHNDLDGSGPVVLLRYIFGSNVDVRHVNNGVMSREIVYALTHPEVYNRYSAIIATDISVNASDAAKIDELPTVSKFILLDHHQTAEYLNQYNWAVVLSGWNPGSFRDTVYKDKTSQGHSSGTSLLFDYLEYRGYQFSMAAKYFSFLVSAYDTWDWKNVFNSLQRCKDLALLFQIYGMEEFDEVFADRLCRTQDHHRLFSDMDKKLLEIEKRRIKQAVDIKALGFKTGVLTLDKAYTIAYSVGSEFMPDVFDRMKEMYPDKDLFVIYYGNGISLRAVKGDVDVAAIAASLGGGGHKAAGGFKIDTEVTADIIGRLFNGRLELQT